MRALTLEQKRKRLAHYRAILAQLEAEGTTAETWSLPEEASAWMERECRETERMTMLNTLTATQLARPLPSAAPADSIWLLLRDIIIFASAILVLVLFGCMLARPFF
jgi:hypothetical protein